MDLTAQILIRELGLQPHPEGGYFRELHRSPHQVDPLDGRGKRAALTSIHFLLPAHQASRWHRVNSDEVWHYLEGGPLELLVSDPDLVRVVEHTLGPLRDGLVPEVVVPPQHWQAARSTGTFTLVACVVGPGFDFADFAMMRDLPEVIDLLQQRQPGFVDLL